MKDIIPIPPVPRSVLYYLLALTNAVLIPLAAVGAVDAVITLIVLNIANVFGFVLAGDKVEQK